MDHELELEVFRVGDYGPKGRWTEADLDQLAQSYDPALHEAPVTLDHAQHGPALGWVGGVRRVGDRLLARLRGLNAHLLEMIRAGAFKKRSVEIYAALREAGGPYLKAVSFLGAAAPEVKGLADPLFSERNPAPLFAGVDALSTDFDFSENPAPAQAAAAPPDAAEPPAGQPAPSENAPQTPETPPEKPPLQLFDDVAARLRATGRWRPAWTELGIAEFYQALATIDEIELAEGKCIEPLCWFEQFLMNLPPVVAMEEAAPAPPAAHGPFESMAPGGPVDAASLELHRRVVAFRRDRPALSYAEALRRCAATAEF